MTGKVARADTPEAGDELLAMALTAAREASEIVYAGWRKRPAIEHKGVVDLVTIYDRESERFLRDRLTSKTSFPFVGEELGGVRAPEGPTWYVDPLDGTTNFVHGHPFFCVSIGLVQGSDPMLGVVVAPALRTEWTGIHLPGREPAATRDGVPCSVSDVSRFADALLATGFPYDRRTSADNNFEAFVAIKKQAQAVRRCGSAAIDLCFVGDGTYDGYWERKLKPWDLAGGAAVVLGGGGRISAYEGGATDFTTGHIVATNGKIHGALVEALAAVPPRR